MTQSFEVIPMASSIQPFSQQSFEPAELFVANELLPMMSSLFPKSASQINSNLAGHGIAYSMMIKGIPVGVVKRVLCDLAEREPERFAPEPQQLKRLCLLAMNGSQSNHAKQEVSIRSLEMQAQVKALTGEISDSEVIACTEQLAAHYRSKGFEVTGRVF